MPQRSALGGLCQWDREDVTGGQTAAQSTLRHPMVWVVLAMALLWVWGAARDDAAYAPPSPQPAAAVSSTDLLFVDGPAGQIVVLEAITGEELARYSSGDGGFLRGILRSLVRERRVRDLEPGGAFHLALLDNGSLVISDPETGYWMALEAFGIDNRRAFAELLDRAHHSTRIAASDARTVR